MHNVISSTIIALTLSFAVAGAATASPNTDGGDAFASKVLADNSTMNVVHAIEGTRNDGEQSSFGFIVSNNRPSQSAAMPEREDPSAE